MHTGPGGSSVAFKSMYVCARMVGEGVHKSK